MMAKGLSDAVQIGVYEKLEKTPEYSLSADFLNQDYFLQSAKSANASNSLKAILSENIGNPGFSAIYDNVTQPPDTGDDSYFPYIVIGDDSVMDWSTDTASGGDIDVMIHVWSRSDGKRETKQIQAAIYALLHRQALTVPDHEFIGCDFDNETSVIDTDMKTFHGTCEYRVYIDEVGYGD